MRGALGKSMNGLGKTRIIPADAGSTSLMPYFYERKPDHPRGCGEHGLGAWSLVSTVGSSPRMRGALAHRASSTGRIRIIPADAGSTDSAAARKIHTRDHPRGCGEHPVSGQSANRGVGSSPRMRGAHDTGSVVTVDMRIIPADAGSTPYRRPYGTAVWDHPRGCGEHAGRGCGHVAWRGSSPRMRGARYISRLYA